MPPQPEGISIYEEGTLKRQYTTEPKAPLVPLPQTFDPPLQFRFQLTW